LARRGKEIQVRYRNKFALYNIEKSAISTRPQLTFAVSVAAKGPLLATMDFPATWVVLQLDQFDTALPDIEGEVTVELLAHLRSSGRAWDHFRFSLNGSTPLEATVGLENIIPVPEFAGWHITHQVWARDIPLRRNMSTSAWVSITDTVARNDCDVTAPDGAGIPLAKFTRRVVSLPSSGPVNASTRWAVVIGEDNLLRLQWQALPLPASIVNGRATFKR
jgi:hypothetical protein